MKKKLLFSLSLFILIMLAECVVMAAPRVSVDANNCREQDVVEVRASFYGKSIGAVDASFSYDSNMLEFIQSDNAEASGGIGRIILVAGSGNADSLSCTLRFKAKTGGQAAVIVNTNSIISFDEENMENASGSAVINIAFINPPPEPTATPEPRPTSAHKPEPSPEETASETAVPETSAPSASPSASPIVSETPGITVHIDGKRMCLARKLPHGAPRGFTVQNVQYNGETIETALCGENMLAYVYETNPLDGAYYIWNKDSGTFTGTFSYQSDLLILPLPQELPNEFSEFKRGEIVNASLSAECLDAGNGFMIVYAEKSGTAGYYLYDAGSGTFQRYHDNEIAYFSQNSADAEASPDSADETVSLTVPAKKSIDITTLALYIMCFITIILAIILAVSVQKSKKRDSYRRKGGCKHG